MSQFTSTSSASANLGLDQEAEFCRSLENRWRADWWQFCWLHFFVLAAQTLTLKYLKLGGGVVVVARNSMNSCFFTCLFTRLTVLASDCAGPPCRRSDASPATSRLFIPCGPKQFVSEAYRSPFKSIQVHTITSYIVDYSDGYQVFS